MWYIAKILKNGGPEEDQLNMKMSANFIQFICYFLSFIILSFLLFFLYLSVNVSCDYRT